MRTVYVDSGAFIALLYGNDRDHKLVRDHYLRLRSQRDRMVTSDPVVGETATRLRYDAGLGTVLEFRQRISQAVTGGFLRIVDVDPSVRSAAFDVIAKHHALELSYADAVGAVVANLVRADAVFGRDEDFVDLGFSVEP